MDSINKLCNKGIYLNNGKIEYQGDIDNTINKYLINNYNNNSQKIYNKSIDDITLVKGEILNSKNEIGNNLRINENWKVRIEFEVKSKISEYVFGIGLLTFTEIPINTSWSNPLSLDNGRYSIDFIVDKIPLQANQYNLVFGITKNKRSLFFDNDFLSLEIENITTDERIEKADGSTGILAIQFNTLINTI